MIIVFYNDQIMEYIMACIAICSKSINEFGLNYVKVIILLLARYVAHRAVAFKT